MRRRHARLARIAGLAALVIGATGIVLAFPWTRDMVRSRAVLPQIKPLPPPENTLAVGRERILLDRLEAEEKLTNPLPASAEIVEQGRQLFEIYCVVCHGMDGRTGGPVGQHFRRVPDLTAPRIQNQADGLLYSIIREGGYAMPAYAESLGRTERWAVVHYLRTLRPPS